jgi:hypothetical protein
VSNPRLRLALAVILSPLLGDIIAMLLPFLRTNGRGASLDYWLFQAGFVLLCALPGYAAFGFFGLPLHHVISRYEPRTLGLYALGGALIGIAMGFFANLFLPAFTDGAPPCCSAEWLMKGLSPSFLLFGIIYGAATACIFWLIRRPDRYSFVPSAAS